MPTEQTEVSGFRAHFRNPRGILGRIAGLLMVITNRRMNRFVVEMLNVQTGDRVLEIGFGPGACIALLAERATKGLVAGVDPSPTMVAQAGARNRTALRSRGVELKAGSVSAIPYPDESFEQGLQYQQHLLLAIARRRPARNPARDERRWHAGASFQGRA